MEMPIKVMVTLFIAIIVGVAVLNFADYTFRDAKKNLNEFNKDEQSYENILEVSQITSSQVGNLARQCYEENKDSLENKICFVLLGEVDAQKDSIESFSGLNSTILDINLENAQNALKIKYNAIKGIVEISG